MLRRQIPQIQERLAPKRRLSSALHISAGHQKAKSLVNKRVVSGRPSLNKSNLNNSFAYNSNVNKNNKDYHSQRNLGVQKVMSYGGNNNNLNNFV